MLGGLQQMNCTLAVRIIRSSNGTFWPMRPRSLSNCPKTFTPLTSTGYPKLLGARNRTRQRYLFLPAVMVSFYIIQKMMAAAYKVHVSVFMKQLLTSKLLFSSVNTSSILSCLTVLHSWVILNHVAKYIAPSLIFLICFMTQRRSTDVMPDITL